MTTTSSGPEMAQGAIYVKTDLSPETVFQAIGRLRQEAQDEIERLLEFLDDLDADADLELSGDELEPSLGAPENHARRGGFLRSRNLYRDASGSQHAWAGGNDDDREGDDGHDDREGDEQEHGGDEHDGREPDVDNEPLLGSFDRFWNQEHAWRQSSGRMGSCWDIHSNCDAEVDRTV